ncbi:DUF2975 domain-containing protein [Limosilactobacillus caccae]|uniref:DUF2975 domain-containing protein n=1 Tax=Limosilactobacillus caccae TaxID=1926284 RepID=UPI000970BF67|nr:DUF2975 domain-containing protein [Limosilactobacillus caccae]
MKNKAVKFLLSTFQIIIDFCILLFILGALMVSLMAGEAIIANSPDAVNWFASANPIIQVSELIDGVILCVLVIIMAFGIRNIIDNINNEQYFVPQNLTAIRKILGSATIIFIIQTLNSTIFTLLQLKDVNNLFTLRGNELASAITFIIILFLVYLVFKRGLSLQKDADSII